MKPRIKRSKRAGRGTLEVPTRKKRICPYCGKKRALSFHKCGGS